jgi:uncharacterized protein DUF2786
MAQDWEDKVRKLLAVAESPSTSEEMAENYRQQAYAIMTKFEIDEANLRDARRAKIENIVRVDWKDLDLGKTYSYEFTYLIGEVASAHGMRGLVGKTFRDVNDKVCNARHYPVIIGFEGDVTRLRLLVESLVRQCNVAMNRFMRTWVKNHSTSWYAPTPSEKYNTRRGFIRGYGERLAERVEEARKVAVQEAVVEGTSTALVLVNKTKQVENWVEQNMTLGITRARKQGWEGNYAGRDAANRADVGQTRMGGAYGAIES